MLASLGEWKEEVSTSETGRDTVGLGNTGMDTVLWVQTLGAWLGWASASNLGLNTRTFWWHTGSP